MVGSVWYVPCEGPAVCALGRSFHSWQATSQALQPMQVLVTMTANFGDLIKFQEVESQEHGLQLDQVPEVRGHGRQRLVRALRGACGLRVGEVVPLLAGHVPDAADHDRELLE